MGKHVDSIVNNAILVSLSISVWTARKFDKVITDQTNKAAHADAKAGRYNKHLLAGAEEHTRIGKIAASARVAHYEQTLPWTDEGWRLLPTENYEAYQNKMRKFRTDFEEAVNNFIEAYPDLREQAKTLLGDLYVANEYPATKNIQSKFNWGTEYSPIPVSSDVRLSLTSDYVSEIQSSIDSRVQRATKAATEDAWARLHKTVSAVKERLSDPDKIFRDSLIGNIENLVDLLTRLNVTGDEDLEAMRKRVADELATLDPEDLRKDKELRAHTADKADEIVKAMGGFFSPTT